MLFVSMIASQGATAQDRGAPTSRPVENLQLIQDRVEQLIKKAIPATVGIEIGNSQGSGVIVSKEGLILTAGHVSGDPGRNCIIILPSGKRIRGKTLGRNGDNDSGMVKIIDAGEYPFVPTGKSSDLKRGQWVVSLGHPGGYQKGRPPVVRLGRVLFNAAPFIDTDCTLVGGDSGGPLFDLEGNVVGIHSRIGDTTVQNIHVPIDKFSDEWAALVKGDDLGNSPTLARARGPYLGVNGSEDPQGYKVESVLEHAAAAVAGVREGDIISKVDGKPIKGLGDLQRLLGVHKVGDEVPLELIREGEDNPVTVKAKLGPRPGA